MKDKTIRDLRFVCVGVAVVSLIGLAICLYALDTPNFTWGWFFAYACLVGLIANGVLASIQLTRTSKEASAAIKALKQEQKDKDTTK